jgi:hypothetical protein
MTDYQKQGEDFLKAHNLEFRAVLVGDDCPRFCEDAQAGRDMDKVNTFPRKTHIHGKHYRCTISGKDRGHIAFDFWNSYADEAFNAEKKAYTSKVGRWSVHGKPSEKYFTDKYRTPTAYDLLSCIEKNDPGTLKDFCDNFGYSDDSMKAFDVYRAVQEEYAKFRRFFTAEEIKEAREIQ